MTFEPVIKIGDILALVGSLVAGLAFVLIMRGELRMLARDVQTQGLRIAKLEEVLIMQARQDERITDVARRIDDVARSIEDLRHGRGFVQRDVDGLWSRGGKIEEG